MSDSRDDAVLAAKMDPTSAQEKYYRRKLIESQIRASQVDEKDGDAKVRLMLGNTSEEEAIRNEVLAKIVQYKPSTPQWYMLVSMCKGLTDPFDQAEYLAHELYETQKTEVAMSYFAPEKSRVRAGFITSAKLGAAAMTDNLEKVEEKIARKGVMSSVASSVTGLGGKEVK